MNKYLLLSTMVAAIGGLLFGFDTAVINGAVPFLTSHFKLSDVMKGWAVSSTLFGCIIGAILIGRPSDRFGRKFCLKFLAALFIISACGCSFAWNLSSFVAFRIIGGFAIGGASVISPMYISEIAPPALRGRLAVTFQLAIVIGILLAFFSDYLLIPTGVNNWRLMFLTGLIPSLAFYVLIFFIQESPRWLVGKGRIGEAENVINKITPGIDTKLIIDNIKNSINSSFGKLKTGSIFQSPYLRLVLIGFTVGFFNQMTGINIVMYYATDIFRSAGFTTSSAIGQTVILGVTNLVFTIIGMFIIDKVGRKRMLLAGSLGMGLFLALFASAYIFHIFGDFALLIFLIGFAAFFALSQGSVIWVLLAEMFPNVIRAKGTSIGASATWIFNALTTFLFPVVSIKFNGNHGIGYIFSFYAIMTFSSFWFYTVFLKETQGKSLEELEGIMLIH